MRFLEEAGEVPEANRLSRSPAVQNAAKELTTAAATAPKPAAPEPNKQAPPLFLAVLVACEDLVFAPSVPLYHRG